MNNIAATMDRPLHEARDVVIVGAGFAGLYMLYRLRELGMSVQVLEAADDVGGTWFWNRYPGARCDVESIEYSYSFSDELQQEWKWTERYAAQPEILRYIQHVADRFRLRQHIRFQTRVKVAEFDPDANRWTVETDKGDRITAPICIMATGCLSEARLPDITGSETFRGRIFHTGKWPADEVSFRDRRVAVIGTGSSAIQLIPEIARQASKLFVFQRTANYCMPARNTQLNDQYQNDIESQYAEVRNRARKAPAGIAGWNIPDKSALEVSAEEREETFERYWKIGGAGFNRAYNDVLINPAANELASDFLRRKISEVVLNPEVVEALTPTYPVGTKRLCTGTDYFETYNRPNVVLVDIRRTPIIEITDDGLRTEDDQYQFDDLVFSTGFDAMTGALLAMDIRIKGGLSLRQVWAHGPVTYLGLMTAGFPNLFMITGPGSPSVFGNVVVAIEQHVEWIANCLDYMRSGGFTRIEAESAAQDNWVGHVNEVADKTLVSKGNSWYVGANIPGKPRVFMPYIGGFHVYRQICDDVTAEGYRGFTFTVENAAQQLANR